MLLIALMLVVHGAAAAAKEKVKMQSYSPGSRACTYSFTIPDHDVATMCHGRGGSQRYIGDTSQVDKTTAKEMLVAVNKLLSRQAATEDVTLAMALIERLNLTLLLQAEQYDSLEARVARVQKEVHRATAGTHQPTPSTEQPTAGTHQPTDQAVKATKIPRVFPNFSGDTTRHRDCPVADPRRIHKIAPIKAIADETVRIVPRSCYEWREMGYRTKGEYLIDPDGVEGAPPFSVECVMASTPFTVVHHSAENRSRVQGYEEEGRYVRNVKYGAGLTEPQLAALAASSSRCEQYLKWECRGAQLSGVSWWTSRQGQRMSYWGGGVYPGSYCACGIDRSCTRGGGDCNCDANVDYVWLEDSGYLSDKDTLPIKSLHMGDTGNYGEDGYHTIGPLRCYSKAMNPYSTSTALLPVETYKPFPVFCDHSGWLVIQRKTLHTRTNFNQGWAAYVQGFGDQNGDFWLGLEHVYQLTSQRGQFYTLQITLETGYGSKQHMNYNYFRVASSSDKYRLEIGEYSGTGFDELRNNRGMQFTTRDSDNDQWRGANCASSHEGGWWFRDCGQVSLNGVRRIQWGRVSNIRKVEMKIKPMPES